jgi:uncharacterized membrane protein YvlD (DUF360 family)
LTIQKERQHNGQKKKDKRRDNTMGKRKRTKGETTQWAKEKGQKERQSFCPFSFDHCVVSPFVLFILTIVLSFLLSFLFCPLCCLSFGPFSFDHCVVSPFGQKKKDKRRDNTMVKIKRTKGETTQWSKEKGQKERQHHCVVSPFVLFLLTIVLSLLLSFFFWPLCCLSFCPFSFGHCVVCPSSIYGFRLPLVSSNSSDRDNTMGKIKRTKGETTQWSKEKGQKERQHNGQKKKDKRRDNTMVKRKRTKVWSFFF